jgi:lysyl-tRNA synthetase class I
LRILGWRCRLQASIRPWPAVASVASWTLDGLTSLVYSVPKLMLGLPADTPPTTDIKNAQREFFKALYQLLCGADTGPRLPTLMLSIGLDRTASLLAEPCEQPAAPGPGS